MATPTERPDILAYAFDGRGGAETVAPETVMALPGEGEGFAWVHLHRGSDAADRWFAGSDVDEVVVEALTAEDTRPRCTVHGDGVVLNLRGVNLNPGAEPEDMVSVRLWIEGRRVVGVWLRPLVAVSDLIASSARNRAPVSPGDFVARLALRLADRAEPTVANLNERVDMLEEARDAGSFEGAVGDLADIRQTAIALRRYMVPQRDALTTLEIEDLDWLGDRDRSRVREAADRVTRLGEELDAIRDRAQVVREQIADRRSEEMNRNMLLLSVVAAIFLPLGLLTGLLGINVGGIPGADNPAGFWVVCTLLGVIVAFQIALARRFRLLR